MDTCGKKKKISYWNLSRINQILRSDVYVIHSVGYNVEQSSCQHQVMYTFYLVDGNYPRWPMFIEPTAILYRI